MNTGSDVIIVGGGPVGLLLAALLRQRGLNIRVLEKRSRPIAHSAAIGITPPSLHILEKLGLAQAFVEAGVKVRDCFVHGQRGPIGCVTFRNIPDKYRFILSLPQATTIALLQAHLGPDGVEHGREVTGLREDGDFCLVQSGGEELRARLVIGCDGRWGRMRGFAGIAARVHAYDLHFVMGDFVDRSGLGDEAHLFFTPAGSVESFPLPNGQRRWIVQTSRHLEHPPEDLVSRLTQERTGIEIARGDQMNESAFTPSRFNCPRYSAGRVVLCGDAAHGMSPIGGQGMNTGFADAELLAEILSQPDPLRLLPVYQKFRRRAAESAMIRAEWGMRLGTWRGKLRSAFRDALVAFLLSDRVAPHLGPFYAMLTIPYNTLERIPRASLNPRPV